MSDAPSGAAVLRDRNADPSIDGALRAWRTETDRRRAEYQAKASAYNQDQQERRKRFFQTLAGTGAVVGACAAIATLAFNAGAPADVAPTYASVVPSLEPQGFAEPERVVAQAATISSLALAGEVRNWTTAGALWIQFDYSGDPMTLHWYDAAGVEVLEVNTCSNRTPSGLSRCYVGRTTQRVQIAREEGAIAGEWTVQACQSGTCSTVARYDVL